MRGTLQGNRMSAKPNKPPQPPDIGSRPRTGYIWMAYSVFFFIEPLVRHQRRFWLVCCSVYPLFVANYIRYIRARTIIQQPKPPVAPSPPSPPCRPPNS